MAKKTTCDGTGIEIPEETPTTGHFGHQYSEEARPIAEEYLKEVDDLHTKAARFFEEGLAVLRGAYRERLAQLPDDPS